MKYLVAGLMLCALVVPVFAEAPNCAGITDDKARLTCRSEARHSYRTSLELALHENGSTAGVFVEESGDFNSGAYPKLIIWTDLDQSAVYKLIDEAKILDGARGAGFRMVQFTDKGDDGHWFFDLTRPGIWPINLELKRPGVRASPR